MILLVTACKYNSTREEIVKKNIETFVVPKLNNPKSYEFVELVMVDSLTVKAKLRQSKQMEQGHIDAIKETQIVAEQAEINVAKIMGKTNFKVVKDTFEQAEVNERMKTIHTIDSTERILGDKINEVISYSFKYSFRENNAFGAKILSVYAIKIESFDSKSMFCVKLDDGDVSNFAVKTSLINN